MKVYAALLSNGGGYLILDVTTDLKEAEESAFERAREKNKGTDDDLKIVPNHSSHDNTVIEVRTSTAPRFTLVREYELTP